MQFLNLFRFGSAILTGICLVKLGLPTADIAVYEALLFLGNLLSFFWVAGGQQALLVLFPKLETAQARKLLVHAFVFFSLLSVAAAGVLFAGGDWLVTRFTNFGALPLLELAALYLLLNAPAFLAPILYLLNGAHRSIFWFGFWSFGAQLLAVVLPIALGAGLREVFICLAALAMLRLLWTLRLLFRYGSWQPDAQVWRRYSWLSVPITLHFLIGASADYIDVLIVASYFEDEAMFAIFRYGARELPLATLLVNGLVAAMLPIVARDPETGMAELRQRSLRLARILYPLSIVLMLISPPLFTWVYSPEFLESARVFNVYLLVLSSRILLPHLLISAQEHNRFLVLASLLETLLNIGLSLWLVRWYGLVGIAYATVLAFLFQKLLLIVYNRAYFQVPLQQYTPVRTILLWNLALLSSFLLSLLLYA